MPDLLTLEELVQTVNKLKCGKAGGSSGILPEMLKAACCDNEFFDLLLSLVCQACKERKVRMEDTNAILMPIPKKGETTKCDKA